MYLGLPSVKGRQSALRTRGPALTQYIPNLRRAGDAPRKATSNADNGNELGIDKAITRIIDSEKKGKEHEHLLISRWILEMLEGS